MDSALLSLSKNLRDFVFDRDTYVITKEIDAEISGILNELDAIKMDNMFLTKSNSWREKNLSNELCQEQSDVLQLISIGESLIYELKSNLNRRNLTSLQANQVRDLNYYANDRLHSLLNSLRQFSAKSNSRVQEYVRDVGIRKWPNTIRNYVNRSSNDLKNSLEKEANLINRKCNQSYDSNDYTYPLQNTDTESIRFLNKASPTNKNMSGYYFTDTPKFSYHTNQSSSAIDTMTSYQPLSQRPKTSLPTYTTGTNDTMNLDWRQAAKEAGIELTFPCGGTEYTSKYVNPKTQNNSYKNLVLNPQPDLTRFNRPFSSLSVDYPNRTEYMSRYEYPDYNKIDKFPWIKNF